MQLELKCSELLIGFTSGLNACQKVELSDTYLSVARPVNPSLVGEILRGSMSNSSLEVDPIVFDY